MDEPQEQYSLAEFLADVNELVRLGLIEVMVDDDIGIVLTSKGLAAVEGIEAA
jgi:hypothetical protein